MERCIVCGFTSMGGWLYTVGESPLKIAAISHGLSVVSSVC
jgi:hypothetical protein